MKTFKAMPPPIRAVFLVFLLVPFAAATCFGWPWSVYQTEGWGPLLLIWIPYGLAPLLLCYSILYRHYLFLPFYLFQCATLLIHAIAYRKELPFDLLLARYALVGMMAYIGVLFGNKDFLFPFVTRRSRFWRMAPRIQVTLGMHFIGEQPDVKIPALMENISVTGMAVSIHASQVTNFFKEQKANPTMKALVRWGGMDLLIPVQVVWNHEGTSAHRFGLKVEDTEVMEHFVASVIEELRHKARHYPAVTQVLSEHHMHQTALALWVFFIVLSFGLPALSML